MEEKPKETVEEKLVKVVLAAGFTAVVAYSVAEAYTRLATPEQKRKWESMVKTHHGEAGAWAVAIALILAAAGASLMFHDRKDRKKWFSGDKR